MNKHKEIIKVFIELIDRIHKANDGKDLIIPDVRDLTTAIEEIYADKAELREGMTEKEYWFKSSEGHRLSAEKYLNKYLALKNRVEELEKDIEYYDDLKRFWKEQLASKYLDREEVEETIVNYKDYLLTYLGFKLEDHPESGKIFWEEYNKAINAILKLAIPECKKCKELKADIDTLKSIHYQKEVADEAVIDDLKAEVEELEGTNRMWKDEIERLKIINKNLIESHQGNINNRKE